MPFETPSATVPMLPAARPPGFTPRAAPGFAVSVFAEGLRGHRWMVTAPDGRAFVSEASRGEVSWLRDADGDGRAEARGVFARALVQPFGMAFHPDGWLYVANTHSVVRFRWTSGQELAAGPPETVISLPGNGYNQHWTRNVVLSPDGARIFVSVGSETNDEIESDPRRAAVSVYDVGSWRPGVFAGGLRNPVGLAFEPLRGALFAVVNERDGMGDDLPPDYLASLHAGDFYGWPYAYFGPHEDPRHAGESPERVARTATPELSLGAHTAPLGLLFYTGARMPSLRGDALIALHGSWNRSSPVGYKIVRARFAEGAPTGELQDLVYGWLHGGRETFGRPAALAQAPTGDVWILDDLAGVIWTLSPR